MGYAGRRIDVRLSAERVAAFDGAKVVADHPRAVTKGDEVLVLDHYLEVLRIKPGALPGSTALARARACGAFSATHEKFWRTARRRLGDAAGTRPHRSAARPSPTAGRRAGGGHGRRSHRDSVDPGWCSSGAADRAAVIPIGSLTRFDRPHPRLDNYDDLLEAR